MCLHLHPLFDKAYRLLFAAGCACGIAISARAQTSVQQFYVPLPEQMIRNTFLTLYSGTGATFDSVVSIVVNGAGTRIVYDHWEDGYEVDIDHPTQASTLIWGDGNNANGTPPGFADDPVSFPPGTVIGLRNLVTLPRNPATLLFDGRDRIGASKAVVVTRAAWATTPGTVLASAVEVSATLDYGTQYVAPIGQDVSAASMFEHAALFVQAAENGTLVQIDADANGAFETAVTLNRGECHQVNGGVMKGARVDASKPVQVHLAAGDIGANYESRWFRLNPVDQWSAVYYTPVGTAADGDPAYVFVHNPQTSSMTVDVSTVSGTTNFTVAGGATYQYQMPRNSGARFVGRGELPFCAVETVGANPSANNVHDWGFTLVPEGNLTPVAICGWGPGSSDLSQNGSPVWVTAVGATTVYVDYDGDMAGPYTDAKGNGYDVSYSLSAFESRTLYDPDKDQTAMRVYTMDGTLIAAAWGQDPAVAGPANPYLDMGTTILPFPTPVLRKTAVIAPGGDADPPGLSIGDTLLYTLTIDNNSIQVLGNVVVIDAPPPSLAYVTNSAFLGTNGIPDDLSGTAFPLDSPGYTIPLIPRGASVTVSYQAVVLAAGSIANSASIGGGEVSVTNVVVVTAAGSHPSTIVFTDSLGTNAPFYALGTNVWVVMADIDANTSSGTVQTVTVVVVNQNNGDFVTPQ